MNIANVTSYIFCHQLFLCRRIFEVFECLFKYTFIRIWIFEGIQIIHMVFYCLYILFHKHVYLNKKYVWIIVFLTTFI